MDESFTVTEISRYLRDLFDSDPLLADLWIRGEVSNWSRARSGHCYFTLKDSDAELRCVIWREVADALEIVPQNGDEIVAGGRISLYEKRGSYQFYVQRLQPLGLGALFERFERLKARLEAEGLFDPAAKRPLPRFPRRIGIVTSPTAAAFQDILFVLRRRMPLVEVLLSPTLVQGSGAAEGIARALERLERVGVDLILVARGGGSIEDLWAFNEEPVARAIHACTIPVISGVGHEIDFTIADFVADLRAPTPSAAAEAAVPDASELRERLRERRDALDDAIDLDLGARGERLRGERRALERGHPAPRLAAGWQAVDELAARMGRAVEGRLRLRRRTLDGWRARLGALDPRATLARGYAVVADVESDALVRRADAVREGARHRVTMIDGSFESEVVRARAPLDSEG